MSIVKNFRRDGYNLFACKYMKEIVSKIDYEKYNNIVDDFFCMIGDSLIDGKSLYIPRGLGILSISPKRRAKYAIIEYGNGNKVRTFNEHTSGMLFHFKWTKGSRRRMKYHRSYTFKQHRLLGRRLASELKSGRGYIYQCIDMVL